MIGPYEAEGRPGHKGAEGRPGHKGAEGRLGHKGAEGRLGHKGAEGGPGHFDGGHCEPIFTFIFNYRTVKQPFSFKIYKKSITYVNSIDSAGKNKYVWSGS